MVKKQSGRENTPMDDYCVVSIENGDSWKGTPLDVEEEQLKPEPTTTATTDEGDKASPPADKEESKHVEEAHKVNDKYINAFNEVKKSKIISSSPTVCPPSHNQVESFQKTPPPPPPLAAVARSKEALSPKSNVVVDPLITNAAESAIDKEAGATAVSLPPSPPPNQLLALAADSGGNGARKDLEDAIQRIEAHIKTEQAARRAAEGALAQARQQQSQEPLPAIQLPSKSSTLPVPYASCAELQVALEALADAQLSMQRAHTAVAYILFQQQQQARSLDKIQTTSSIKEKIDALSSPSIRHSARASPALTQSLPPYDGDSTGDVLSSPPLAKAITKDRGMSWVAAGPKESLTKQNWATPTLKGKAGALNDILDGSQAAKPSSKGGTMTTTQSPRGPFKKKELNKLPSSPKSGTSLSNKRSDSGIRESSPPRGGHGVNSATASVTTEWNNDRFATGKAEAFMLSQAARWNTNSKRK